MSNCSPAQNTCLGVGPSVKVCECRSEGTIANAMRTKPKEVLRDFIVESRFIAGIPGLLDSYLACLQGFVIRGKWIIRFRHNKSITRTPSTTRGYRVRCDYNVALYVPTTYAAYCTEARFTGIIAGSLGFAAFAAGDGGITLAMKSFCF
jgi:hypothetical protein